MSRVLDLLVTSRALIAREEDWTKWAMRYEKPDHTYAYCAAGAIQEATKGDRELMLLVLDTMGNSLLPAEREIAKSQLSLPGPVLERYMVAAFNNATNHASVLRLFDRTIARYRQIEALEKLANSEPEATRVMLLNHALGKREVMAP